MPFETYVPQRGPGKADTPVIRILKNGTISVSPAAVEQHFKGANYAELLYDSRSKKIGIKPRRKPTKASYKLRDSPQGGNRKYISGQQFLEHCGIKTGKAQNFEAKWNGRAGVVAISVK